METPNRINTLEFICDCSSININKWNKLMEDTTKANGKKIREHIKQHAPEIYDQLVLQYPNPYESQSKKKKGLLVYVHSDIEYFFKYN